MVERENVWDNVRLVEEVVEQSNGLVIPFCNAHGTDDFVADQD